MTLKLHPLHTATMIYEHLRDTGEYLGVQQTGRSTALALGYIAEAIRRPGVHVYTRDHWDRAAAHTALTDRVAEYIELLGLKHFTINRQCYWIRFGD